MNRNYLPVWLALGALLIAVLLAIGVEPPPLPSAPAPKTVSVTLARTNLTSGEWTRWTRWTECVVRRAELPASLYLRLGMTNEWR